MMAQASAAPGPAKGEHDAELLVEKAPDRPLPPKQQQQHIAGDHWRQHQRQEHERIEERAPVETGPRQHHGDGDAEGQARRHGERRDAQGELDRGEFFGCQREHKSATPEVSGGKSSVSREEHRKVGPQRAYVSSIEEREP